MLIVAMLALIAIFFALFFGFVAFCDRIVGRGQEAQP